MKKFLSFKPYPGTYKNLPPSDACIIMTLLLLLCIQVFFLCHKINEKILNETIIRYGEVNEGVVGVPIYKNPLYAVNTAEKDMLTLIHAGLLKHNNEGAYIPHLAEKWNREDQNTYMFTLKEGISFHDGTPITSEDVVYTIEMIQEEQRSKNQYHDAWSGVQVFAENKSMLKIIVPEGNLHFPESFTAPILPKHIWKKIPKEKRMRYKGPGAYIGAGPYEHTQETVTLDEQPINITLKEFPGYALGRPFIQKITLHFFVDVKDLLEAYKSGSIDGVHSVAATELSTLLEQGKERTDRIYTATTNRVFGIFFNTEDGRILQDSFLRSILSRWVKRNRIVTEVFKSHADPIQAPLATDKKIKESDISLEELRQTLEDIGWNFEATTGKRERNSIPLEINFIVLNTEETRKTAEIITNGWQRMEIDVKTTILGEKEISRAIREKEFDVMLYGYQANSIKDLVGLWKSGDTENLASITNFGSPTLNKMLTSLEKARSPNHPVEWKSEVAYDKWLRMVYNEIKVEMEKNVPAIFLYSPHFLYILPEEIKGVGLKKNHLGRVYEANDRFLNVHKWHLKKERVWKFLIEN